MRRGWLGLLLLPAACLAPDGNPSGSGPTGGNTICGTSCGGGNPPAFVFDKPFTGTVSIFAASQNPVMDSVPFAVLDLDAADSLHLKKGLLDSILGTDKLDSILKYTLTDSARKARPESLLEFNVAFVSGDSAWLVPGLRYRKGSHDSDLIVHVPRLKPFQTFRGKAAIPWDPNMVDWPKDFIYIGGTPFSSPIGSDSVFNLGGYPSETPLSARIFRYFRHGPMGSADPSQIILMESKNALSGDGEQVLQFEVVVDSIATTWKLCNGQLCP